jgi:RNA polymerase sigma-70 factor (ECF subfamily)
MESFLGFFREQSDPASCPEGQAGIEAASGQARADMENHSPRHERPSGRADGAAEESASVGDAPEVVEWIRRAREGDREAFESLIAEYQDRVWRRALYRLGDYDEAYDLAQEVLLTCFRKIHQFRGESKFWTWLGRIVDNHVKNRVAWLTRRGKDKTFSLDAPIGEGDENRAWMVPDASAGPRRQVENQEAMDALHRNLEQLSPDHREVLLLRFSDGLSYEEIAETLQVSLGTVKSRINRARVELRSLMDEFL